eukprot:COSAG02_NODE_4973_length_4769_cov_62.553319_6_plen_104_part_00
MTTGLFLRRSSVALSDVSNNARACRGRSLLTVEELKSNSRTVLTSNSSLCWTICSFVGDPTERKHSHDTAYLNARRNAARCFEQRHDNVGCDSLVAYVHLRAC